MALALFNESQQGACFVIIIVCTPIAILAAVLRFVATNRSRRKLGWEDFFALLALLINLAYNAMLMWILISMNGISVFEYDKLPYNTVRSILKVGYFMNQPFCLNQTAAKISLLILYRRIFSSSKTFKRWVWGVGFLQVCWSISMFLSRVFMCVPVYKVWEPATPGTCIDDNALLAGGEAFNSAVDFLMVGMAIHMIRQLQMASETKWKLGFIFALGGFSGVIGVIKVALAYGSVGANILNAIWDVVQMCITMICCCAPIYRTLLPKMDLFKTLKSSFRSRSTGSMWRRSGKKSSSTGSSVPSGELEKMPPTQNWMHLDGSSERELAWVETGPHPPDLCREGTGSQDSYWGDSLQGVQVHRTVEVV